MIRPIFYLKKGPDGGKINELINGDYSLIQTWKTAIHGYLYNQLKISVDFNTNTYFKQQLDELKKKENLAHN